MSVLARLRALPETDPSDPNGPAKTFEAQVTVAIDEAVAEMIRNGHLRKLGFTAIADELGL